MRQDEPGCRDLCQNVFLSSENTSESPQDGKVILRSRNFGVCRPLTTWGNLCSKFSCCRPVQGFSLFWQDFRHCSKGAQLPLTRSVCLLLSEFPFCLAKHLRISLSRQTRQTLREYHITAPLTTTTKKEKFWVFSRPPQNSSADGLIRG